MFVLDHFDELHGSIECARYERGCSGAATTGTLRIGIDLPVSGADAAIGVPTENGVILAIEEANKRGFAGGTYKLEASLLDDTVQGKHDPAAGAQNVKTFIADSAVLAMVGPFNSNVAKSEIPLTNDAGLAQISASATNDGLTIGDDAKKLRTAHPDTNAFFPRDVARTTRTKAARSRNSAKTLKFKKVFIIDGDETYGKGLADSVRGAPSNGSAARCSVTTEITANQVDFDPC